MKNIFDVFFEKFDYCAMYMNRCEMGYTKNKFSAVFFFLPKVETIDIGQACYEERNINQNIINSVFEEEKNRKQFWVIDH